MIFREPIPEELQLRFLSLFGKPLETYWDPFWGWKDHNDQFEIDFPTLTDQQYELIQELMALEQSQFEEIQRIATIQLDIEPMLSYQPVAKQKAIKASMQRWLPMEE